MVAFLWNEQTKRKSLRTYHHQTEQFSVSQAKQQHHSTHPPTYNTARSYPRINYFSRSRKAFSTRLPMVGKDMAFLCGGRCKASRARVTVCPSCASGDCGMHRKSPPRCTSTMYQLRVRIRAVKPVEGTL